MIPFENGEPIPAELPESSRSTRILIFPSRAVSSPGNGRTRFAHPATVLVPARRPDESPSYAQTSQFAFKRDLALREQSQQISWARRNDQKIVMDRLHETLFHERLHESKERVEEVLDIEDTYRFVNEPELQPSPHFEEFLECTDASGQRDERICERYHETLTLVHCLDLVNLCDSAMGQFLAGEELRDDPDDRAASVQHCIGEDAHQASRRRKWSDGALALVGA